MTTEPMAQAPRSGSVGTASAAAEVDPWSRLPRPLSGPPVLAAALGAVAIATLIGTAAARLLPPPSVSLVYLLFVVLVAIGLGTRTGVATAFLAFLAYNFFFIPPIYTFAIADPQELFALIVFFIVALLTGSLAGRMREIVVIGRGRLIADTSIAEFTRRSTGSHVRVVSPHAARFAPVLQGAGAAISHEEHALIVTGLEADRIGALAAEHRFELHELAPRRASLEAAFMELTQGSQEYQGARSAATAVAPGVLAPTRMEN